MDWLFIIALGLGVIVFVFNICIYHKTKPVSETIMESFKECDNFGIKVSELAGGINIIEYNGTLTGRVKFIRDLMGLSDSQLVFIYDMYKYVDNDVVCDYINELEYRGLKYD